MATDLRTAGFVGGSFAGMIAPLGTKKPIVVDISQEDFTITEPCRVISAISGTVIYVDMECVDGTIENVKIPISGGAFSIVNVTKIKKTGTDATGIYVWPME